MTSKKHPIEANLGEFYCNRVIKPPNWAKLINLSVFRVMYSVRDLKEYYEIVGESRPLSAFFPTHADFLTEMYFYS